MSTTKITFKSQEQWDKYLKDNKDRIITAWGDKEVYDLTSFADSHPGGEAVIKDNAGGKDFKEGYQSIGHSSSADKQMQQFLIGTLEIPKQPKKDENFSWGNVVIGASVVGIAVALFLKYGR